MTDETRPDAKGCPNCGRIDCGDFLADEYPRCDGLGIPPMRVDWQSYAARLVEEQRAKAMEAAARVYLRGLQPLRDFDDAREAQQRRTRATIAAIVDRGGEEVMDHPSHSEALALEVLRAFEIVK